MKFKITYILAFFFLIVVYSCNNFKSKEPRAFYPKDLKQLHRNVLNYYINQQSEDGKVEMLSSKLTTEGTWLNIDYSNKRKSEWPVKNHLKYVQTLGISYNTKTSKFYQDKALLEKIHKSLNYWLDNDFLSANWHDQHIGVPKFLLPILLLMENELTQEQLNKGIVISNRAKIKMSGQNKVWLATNVLLRALLQRQSDVVATASKAIQGELKVSKKVGLKADGSYHEHGAQMQFGNYGLWYLENMIQCYALVHNTPFAFKTTKIDILRHYILEGQQWILWNNTYDANALGRHFYKNEQLKKAKRLKVCLETMQQLDKAHADAYSAALDTKTLSGNKHFWKSDFQVHRRKDFYFSVKMSSKRVVGTESVNQENIQGYYAGDGVALLSVNNKAYQDIFPFWDWKKLPGTTVIQNKAELPSIKFRDFKTNGSFVGGVSNGTNGIATMAYDRDGVKAKKSWFMFADKIVCLGSGISSDKKDPLSTAINQSFFKNKVIISADDKIQTNIKHQTNKRLDWVLHDSIGYMFPKSENVNLSTRILVGNWNNVAKRYRPVLLTEHIFKLGINHGSQPKKASYNYILVPNASQETMVSLHKNNPFKIINTKTQHAVATTNGKKAGIVFFEKGTSPIKGGITVNQPCVILLEDTPNAIAFSISDPTQKLLEIDVQIEGNYKLEGSTIYQGKTKFTVQLPRGENSGKTIQLQLEKK